ncbi:fibronectin type III domain-containing protein [Micromonospora yasonensis]|uniref:fibronectin type III domain-containing protein n=1 Tax=Micromonospora yasonensis TaxID=1128667 RepID=UPI0022317C7A|nr:fibronectin type III domain-containing protein [Micromonospora yasonensis]MCW3840022.1 fibronectin type III domain-containing protein [Micromonospora yasonensis]
MSGPSAAAPVSASPVPPWGLTAPPWSSVGPPQPVDRPADAGASPEPTAEKDDEADRGPVDPTMPRPAEPEDDKPRALPVYDELLEFPESEHPAPGPQAYPEQGAWPAVPAPFHQPPAYPVAEEEPEPRGRNRAVAVAVGAAVVAVVAAVGVGAVVLNRDAAPDPGPTAATGGVKPKVSGPPPGDLKLRDDSTTITVTWTDPSNGGVPFVVAGGRAGQKLGVMATVDPGTTKYTVNGLSPKLDYCFTVLAVYSTDTYATSGQVCTDRERGSAAN